MSQSFLSDEALIFYCLCLAVFRIYLEVIKFNFNALPLTKMMGEIRSKQFHKMGLYLSIGYVLLFAPQFLI